MEFLKNLRKQNAPSDTSIVIDQISELIQKKVSEGVVTPDQLNKFLTLLQNDDRLKFVMNWL